MVDGRQLQRNQKDTMVSVLIEMVPTFPHFKTKDAFTILDLEFRTTFSISLSPPGELLSPHVTVER